LLDHVADLVELKVILRDGVPCCGSGRGFGQPLAEIYRFRPPMLYVCPKTGLLRALKLKPRQRR